jgi:hypothetical protein
VTITFCAVISPISVVKELIPTLRQLLSVFFNHSLYANDL